jgi:addiction module HigA family antidote
MMRRSGLRRPTHPGALLREDLLPEINLTQTALADLLQVSRRTINEIVQEHRPVTTDMACRLARAFGNSPQFWLNMQQAVDIWEALQEKGGEYERIELLSGNPA